MTVDELVAAGVCEDLEEVLRMFPLEMLDDFRVCGPQGLMRDGVLDPVDRGDHEKRIPARFRNLRPLDE